MDTLTQQELALKLMIDKSTVSRIIEAFASGLCFKSINPNNRRETLVSITDKGKGKRANERIEELRRSKYQSILEGISADKQQEVLSSLFYLVESLKKKKENITKE